VSRRSLMALPGLLVILALLIGAWTSVPGVFAQTPQPGGSGTPQATGVPVRVNISILTGAPAQVPGLQAAFSKVNKFNLQAGQFGSSFDQYDKLFVEEAFSTNKAELAVLRYALTRVTNTDLKNLVQFMIDQHSSDSGQLLQLQQRVNNRKTANLTNSRVFPGTANYELGIRTENLQESYLNRLKSFSGNTKVNSAFYSGADFDLAALDVLMEMHAADLQTELAAQRFLKNKNMEAFAHNGAAMTEMHLKLMDALHDQLFVGIQPASSFEPNQGTGGGGNPTAVPSAQPSVQPTMVP
jgi:hypothetical protein